MRKTRDDIVSDYADEFAGEGFDKLDEHAWEWLRLANRAEYAEDDAELCEQVLADAISLVNTRIGTEQYDAALAKLRRTLDGLRLSYVDFAHDNGLYGGKAQDYVSDLDAAAAEDAWERDRDDRALEAYEAGIRG